MKKLLGYLAIGAIAAGTGLARADTINFSQFGPEFTNLGSPIAGITTDGVGVHLTSPNGGFQTLVEGSGWHGIFPLTAPILWDLNGAGPITLDFDTGIGSLTLAGQANNYGAYTETATAYCGASLTLCGTATAASFNHVGDSYPLYTGTVPFLTLTAADIRQVQYATTNDGAGLALYGGAGVTIPEPATLALLGIGLAGLGFSRRRKLT